jgi:hypothetical protein
LKDLIQPTDAALIEISEQPKERQENPLAFGSY